MPDTLRWRHNDHAGVSNHQPHGCLLNRLFRRKSKKTSKLRVTGLCAGNSPGAGEFPAQMASYAENVSIWWRHHESVRYNYLSIPKLQRLHRYLSMLGLKLNHVSKRGHWGVVVFTRVGACIINKTPSCKISLKLVIARLVVEIFVIAQ